jgi:beta-lactamase class A
VSPARKSRRGRGWLTLLLLLLAVTAISLGPATLCELVTGLAFRRPPATSIQPRAVHQEPDLQARIERASLSIARGRLAAAVIDLQTGASAEVDAERSVAAASLFKLPILVEVLAREDAGSLDGSHQLEIRPDDWTDGSGVLQARVGERLSVRELTRLMIQESDNIAALVLLDAVGVQAVNARAEQLGLAWTRLVDRRAGEVGQHTTSAGDMAHLLLALVTGQAVNARVSEDALKLLELRQSVSWLADGLPFWVKVAHKWGDLPAARNDAGVVFTPRGSYAAAVLTEDAQPDEAAAAIARVSRAAYDYLGARSASRL